MKWSEEVRERWGKGSQPLHLTCIAEKWVQGGGVRLHRSELSGYYRPVLVWGGKIG